MKQKCPICNKEFSNVGQHLVITHDVLNIEHLRTLIPQNSNYYEEQKSEGDNKDILDRKEIMKTIIDVQSNARVDLRLRYIEKLQEIIQNHTDNDMIILSSIQALMKNLNHSNILVKKKAEDALRNLLGMEISEENKRYILNLLG